MRIVLGNSSLIKYFEGGGAWSWFLQYPIAFKAAGHEVLWLELLQRSGDREQDLRIIRRFHRRLASYDLAKDCAVLLFNGTLDVQPLPEAELFGIESSVLNRWIRDADLLLNFACAIHQPLLSLFKRKVLLDGDPGHLQIGIAQLEWDLDLHLHDVFLTVGSQINAPDSMVPKLGHQWHTFDQLIYLPLWPMRPDPGRNRPFTSVTQWTWEELHYNGQVLSVSKRDAYLRYLQLPRLLSCHLELAANIGPSDPSGDAARLRSNGWTIVDPHEVASSPERYHQYIRDSRGEFMCPKPIHVALKTGWFSERSLAYLATGRPVAAEETGFSKRIPTGMGLIAFHDLETAAAAVTEIDANYERHQRAAREIVEAHFDWRTTVAAILAACST